MQRAVDSRVSTGTTGDIRWLLARHAQHRLSHDRSFGNSSTRKPGTRQGGNGQGTYTGTKGKYTSTRLSAHKYTLSGGVRLATLHHPDWIALGLEIDSGTTGLSIALAREPRQSAKCCRTAGIEPAWTGLRWKRRGRRPVRNDESAMGLESGSGTTIADVVSHRVNRGWFTR